MTPKEHPILFSSDMMLAILEDRKTQTRRVIKPQPTDNCTVGFSAFSGNDRVEYRRYANDSQTAHQSFVKCPFGVAGDRLWVMENVFFDADFGWRYCAEPKDIELSHESFRKVHGQLTDFSYSRTRCPSIHLPRKFSRITLEVTGVKVERINDISGTDAIAEGWPHDQELFPTVNPQSKAQEWFKRLWESINGKRKGCSWADNPWVWAVSFRRI